MDAEPSTPYLVVDQDVLERNLRAMADLAAARNLTLRPHAKTHKCVPIARRQLALGAAGLTVATVGEAEVFADAGCADLFIAYPVWAAGRRGARLRALAERVRLCVGVDSEEGARVLSDALPAGTEVMVEVDSGHHRTGVAPELAGRLGLAAERAGLRVRGVFTFPGHGYHPTRRGTAARDEADALRLASDALKAAGLDAPVRSGGSTPTAALVSEDGPTELRPGVYVFNDAQQVELGSCGFSEVALTGYTTVVSRGDGRMVLDAGSKVLGADQLAWASGGGRLPDHPEARITSLSEHHATVLLDRPPPLGALVRVVPNHVCAAVNLADELFVRSKGKMVEGWPVTAAGANS